MLRRLVVIVGLVTVTGATGDLVGSPQEPPQPGIEIVCDIAYASGPSHNWKFRELLKEGLRRNG